METLTISELDATSTDPGAPAWDSVPSVTVPLVPVPIDAQPNAYIRAAWKDRGYGRTAAASMALARSGENLLVRLSWEASGPPMGEFPDACAVIFPQGQGPEDPGTMGSHTEPVTVWHWRDRSDVQQALPAARHLVASGPGVFHPAADARDLAASAAFDGTRWSVVVSGPAAALAPGGRVAVAVWDGTNDERAGIGAVSATWTAVTA